MMGALKNLEISDWCAAIPQNQQLEAIEALESGSVIYMPTLPFQLEQAEVQLLSPDLVDGKRKNISFDWRTDKVSGCIEDRDCQKLLQQMMRRFAKSSKNLMELLFPHYVCGLDQERTSYRPVEIQGRASSYRKDDTRLHVDAFPSRPTQGRRILRLFTNINPDSKARVWRVGEPFGNVAKTFMPHIKRPLPGSSKLMQQLGITKGPRSLYDHYMLNIHDCMKADTQYQDNASQNVIELLPGATWIVYTDLVSHAVISGQYILEQTFTLPVSAMYKSSLSPLRVLEKLIDRALV